MMVVIVFTIFIVGFTRAENNSPRCNHSCGVGKSVSRLHYPFGFSQGCPIRLNCSGDDGIIKIGEFRVQNVTPNNIFVDVPAKCNRRIQSIAPLFDRNYALTWQNSLLLQNCTSQAQHLTGCEIPTSMVENWVNLQGCDVRSRDNISCYSGERGVGTDFLSYGNVTRTQCHFLFSSIAVDSEKTPGVSFELNRVELGWWLDGPCRCSRHANCSKILLVDGKFGFQCRCDEGFHGDGFADGDGCRKSKSFSRRSLI